jgi:hypothetical protein
MWGAALSVPLWLSPLAWRLAYAESESLSLLGLFLLFIEQSLGFVVLFAVGTILISPFLFLFRSNRARTAARLGLAVVFVAFFFLGLHFGHAVWHDCVGEVVARSEPLATAVEAYVVEQGRPPHTLADLVPKHVTAIPTTGIGTRPQFHLIVDEPSRYDGNPWVLLTHPPCYVMGFDLLLFFPRQNYPQSGYGGWLERFDRWAYVHE